jgi:NhaP-type Na+/H+ and K+/H+ antiporter
LGIASSKVSARLGLPVLVLFLVLGMLAGDEGIGGIAFENYHLAYGIGTLALVIILFDGGLSTSLSAFRAVWRPSLLLATLGVLITALVTGMAAVWILNLPLLVGLLLGSIVGSTDAAAVFSILRHGGTTLPQRLSSTLEVESASNDPMAIFLTIGCIELLTGRVAGVQDLLGLFLAQMVVGTLGGLAIGFLAVWIINHINLRASGLYPVLVSTFGLLAFGLTNWLGGSGFLAVYLAGLVIGNNRIAFQRGIRHVHDAAAWLAQILMFIMLGLLSFPSRMIAVSGQGLLIGVVLILVARPIAVGVIAPLVSVQPAGNGVSFLGRFERRGADYAGHLSAAGRDSPSLVDFRCGLLCRCSVGGRPRLDHALPGSTSGIGNAQRAVSACDAGDHGPSRCGRGGGGLRGGQRLASCRAASQGTGSSCGSRDRFDRPSEPDHSTAWQTAASKQGITSSSCFAPIPCPW